MSQQYSRPPPAPRSFHGAGGVCGPCVCVCVISPLHLVPLAGRCPTDAPGPPNPQKRHVPSASGAFQACLSYQPGLYVFTFNETCFFRRLCVLTGLVLKENVQPKMKSFPPVSRCSFRSPLNISGASQLNSDSLLQNYLSRWGLVLKHWN